MKTEYLIIGKNYQNSKKLTLGLFTEPLVLILNLEPLLLPLISPMSPASSHWVAQREMSKKYKSHLRI